MRSYEAARKLFSFLGFCSWCMIVFGVIAAVGGGASAAAIGGVAKIPTEAATFLATLPGLGTAVLGFFCLAFVQMGRAAVDSAEYAQQSLKIARDQLELSRQSLVGGRAETGFASLPESGSADAGPSFASLNGNAPKQGAADVEKLENDEERIEPTLNAGFLHNGQWIPVSNNAYRIDGQTFESKEAVIAHIDRQNEKA